MSGAFEWQVQAKQDLEASKPTVLSPKVLRTLRFKRCSYSTSAWAEVRLLPQMDVLYRPSARDLREGACRWARLSVSLQPCK